MRNSFYFCHCSLVFPRNILRVPPSLLSGIVVGFLLGIFANFLKYYEVAKEEWPEKAMIFGPFFDILPDHLKRKTDYRPPPQICSQLWLRCVIMLESGKNLWPEKNFAAIRETWGGNCNETLFFTDSQRLQNKNSENLPPSMRIFLSIDVLQPREWTSISNVIQFIAKTDLNKRGIGNKWTILTDGRSYIHTDNLRSTLCQVDDGIGMIVGRKIPPNNWFLSRFFPFAAFSQIALSSIDSPLIISQLALHLISSHCSPNFHIFGAPRHVGKALAECARRLAIALWDPVDDESRPLIVSSNLRSAFSGRAISSAQKQQQKKMARNSIISGGQLIEQHKLLANCCSDRAIAFALLNHKDQRLIDYGVRRLKVFGESAMRANQI